MVTEVNNQLDQERLLETERMVFLASTSGSSDSEQSSWGKAASLSRARLKRALQETTRSRYETERLSSPSKAPRLLSARARADQAVSWAVLLGFLLLILLKSPGLEYFLTSRYHGYQLCIATQILMGKVPGIDIITAYGPMAMYTSALGLRLSDSLLGETTLCALGYAMGLFLIFWLVKNHSTGGLGLMAAGAGFLVQARFYKWYIWLIPLGTLWALHHYATKSTSRRWRWAMVTGFVLGLSWLYRLDIGTLEFVASLVFIAIIEAGHPPRRYAQCIRTLGLFTASFSILPLCWFGYLAIVAGTHAPLVFLRTTIEGALTVSQGMAQSVPPIRVLVLAYVLVPSTLLLAAGIGIAHEWVGRADSRSRFLLAAALTGLGVFHQAIHRMDPPHLLQVIPPAIVCAFLLLAIYLHRITAKTPRRLGELVLVSSGLVYFLLVGYVGARLIEWGRQDLIGLSSWSAGRYVDLAHPLGSPDRFPLVKAIRVIRQQTDPAEPILVFPLDCQFYALAQRKLSGRLHAYYAGVFDAPVYRFETLQSIRKEMPALVVLPSDRNQPPNGGISDGLALRSRVAHHYLENFIRENYRRIVYDDGVIRLLGRGG
jgi:hypothetical protein